MSYPYSRLTGGPVVILLSLLCVLAPTALVKPDVPAHHSQNWNGSSVCGGTGASVGSPWYLFLVRVETLNIVHSFFSCNVSCVFV